MVVCRWNFPGGRPASNFDTFVVALLTVFQVRSLFSFFSRLSKTPVGGRSIAISMSVYQFVCLFVCLFAGMSQKPRVQMSPNFLYMLPVVVAQSFFNSNTLRCVLLGFVDDVMFSHNGAKHDAYVPSSSPGGGMGAKSAVYDCILLVVLLL